MHKQRYCVTRLNHQRKLVCFRYCAIFEHISSGSTTWPNSKCLFCHLIVRVCRSHVVPFKTQRVIFHPELSIHARYQNTSQLNILNITSVADINFTSFHKLNVCVFQTGSVWHCLKCVSSPIILLWCLCHANAFISIFIVISVMSSCWSILVHPRGHLSFDPNL